MTSALSELDGSLRVLMFELEKRKILDCVNIMVVSDHGMDQYNSSFLVDINQVRGRVGAGQWDSRLGDCWLGGSGKSRAKYLCGVSFKNIRFVN